MTLLHTTFPLAICLSFVANFPIFSNGINISGKVVDSQDFAVEGVNVRLMLIGDSAITDKNGNFSIISSGIIVPKKRNINTIYNPEYSHFQY